MSFKKNTAVTGFTVGLVSSTDGSDITTGTPVGYSTLDGGTQTAIGDVTPVHEGNGQWSFDLTAGEMNGDIVGLTFTHTSAITAHFTIKTETVLASDLNDVAATDIVSAGAITTLSGAVVNVDLVDTTTTNTDMRGTDSAATAANLATVDTNVDAVLVDTGTTLPAQITGLNNFDPTTDTVALVTTTTNVTNQVTADAVAISGDTTAADNLEAMYDGTGYTDDTAPSTQSQLSSLTNVGSAVHSSASSYVLTTGTQSANLYTDTEALDNVRHTHTDTAGAIDLYYEHLIGAGTPSSVQVTGAVTGSNDNIGVYGYNWVTTSWVQIGTFSGTNSSANRVEAFDMFTSMVGSGADEGKVRVRFYAASGLTSATLYVDQVFVAYSAGVEGYDNGAVWFNSNVTNTGTTVNVDGTARNPVSTSAALLALLASTGLHKVEVTPASTLTLGGAYEGYNINGNGSVLALGSQNVGGTVFSRFASVTGVATTTGDATYYEDCVFGTATLAPYTAQQCGFGATVSQAGAGDYTHVDCYSTVAGTGSPTFTRTGAGTATGEYRRFSGGMVQSGITGSDTYTIGGEMGGITLQGASGTVEIRGTYKSITDSRTGSPTLGLDGAILGGDVASILVDTTEIGVAGAGLTDLGGMSTGMKAEVNTEADTALTDYDGPTNTEFEVRTPTAAQLAYMTDNAATGLPVTFTTSGGGTTTAVINLVDGSSGSATDDQYNGRLLVFTSGSLKGVVTDITDYVGSTTTATITAIPTAPTASHSARLI